MAFVIHGRDPLTGEKTDPFFSNATTEELAREEATSQGLLIDLVERHEDRTPVATTSLSTLGSARPLPERELQYEFLPHHNRVIAGLAATMNTFGLVLMALSALYVGCILAIPREQMPAPVVPAVLSLIFGGLILYAADAFRKIVRTQGHDVDHLMNALVRLRFIFGLMMFVAALAAAALVVVIAVNG